MRRRSCQRRRGWVASLRVCGLPGCSALSRMKVLGALRVCLPFVLLNHFMVRLCGFGELHFLCTGCGGILIKWGCLMLSCKFHPSSALLERYTVLCLNDLYIGVKPVLYWCETSAILSVKVCQSFQNPKITPLCTVAMQYTPVCIYLFYFTTSRPHIINQCQFDFFFYY